MSNKGHHDDEEHGGNHERWLLTYSDMITLLLALFIILFAISNVNAQKFAVIARGFVDAFNGDSSRFIGEGASLNENNGTSEGLVSINQSAVKRTPNPDASPAPTPPEGINMVSTADFNSVYQKLEQYLQEKSLADDIVVVQGEDYILIKFAESVLFYPNKSQIRPEAMPVLQTITDALKTIDTDIEHIRIEGHTADVGIDNKTSFYSWQLSSERGLAVLKFFTLQGNLPQEKMSIEAFSHYKPASDNETSEGMAKNRRVEVMISRADRTPNQ